jgi:hypothetical protein
LQVLFYCLTLDLLSLNFLPPKEFKSVNLTFVWRINANAREEKVCYGLKVIWRSFPNLTFSPSANSEEISVSAVTSLRNSSEKDWEHLKLRKQWIRDFLIVRKDLSRESECRAEVIKAEEIGEEGESDCRRLYVGVQQ